MQLPSFAMLLPKLLTSLMILASHAKAASLRRAAYSETSTISPKVMIVSMFAPEGEVWTERFASSGLGDFSSVRVHVPGLSMLFSQIRCTSDGRICHVTVGEGEINAAASMMAVVLANGFDLRETYFLLGGIAGVNPRYGTLGSVALARYAVQVALQYELDARSVPNGWPTGYIPYGRKQPLEYPAITYGSEVFEINVKLRDVAYKFASKARLDDGDGPRQYRTKYLPMGSQYKQATKAPSMLKCDSATSDVYYSGTRLAEAFENTTQVLTNGTGVYCMSAQEDNAILESLIRGAIEGLVDFARVIVMRAGSNFDRPPPGQSDYDHLTAEDQNGFEIAINNTYIAGVEIVRGIVKNWNCTFRRGITPSNYIGDNFGSLGGHPDFGLGSLTDDKPIMPATLESSTFAKREMSRRQQFGPRAISKI